MITPKEFKTTILEKNKIADETYEIKLVRPKDFEYEAGQYIIIRVFSKMNDGKAPVRALSLSSSPSNKEILSTCFRYDSNPSDFKKILIEKESQVTFRGPLGKFILPLTKDKHITMIAGGVGIVPFVGMLKHLKEINSTQKVKLIYTDKSKKKMAYLTELKELEKHNKNLELITRTKRVNKKFLEENTEKESIFYICGMPEMVEDVAQMLRDLEVKEENLILEKY